MLEFKKASKNIDLFTKYKKNDNAKLSLCDHSIINRCADFITFYIHDTLLEKDNPTINNSRVVHIEDSNIVALAEDYHFDDGSIIRVYAKYNIINFDLDLLFIKSDSMNVLFEV